MRYHKNRSYWTKTLLQGGYRLFWESKTGEIKHISEPFRSEKEANAAGRAAIEKENS